MPMAVRSRKKGQRIGVGKGLFAPYVPNPELDKEIAELMRGKRKR